MLDLKPLHRLYQQLIPSSHPELPHPLIALAELTRKPSSSNGELGALEWVVGLGGKSQQPQAAATQKKGRKRRDPTADDEWWEAKMGQEEVEAWITETKSALSPQKTVEMIRTKVRLLFLSSLFLFLLFLPHSLAGVALSAPMLLTPDSELLCTSSAASASSGGHADVLFLPLVSPLSQWLAGELRIEGYGAAGDLKQGLEVSPTLPPAPTAVLTLSICSSLSTLARPSPFRSSSSLATVLLSPSSQSSPRYASLLRHLPPRQSPSLRIDFFRRSSRSSLPSSPAPPTVRPAPPPRKSATPFALKFSSSTASSSVTRRRSATRSVAASARGRVASRRARVRVRAGVGRVRELRARRRCPVVR